MREKRAERAHGRTAQKIVFLREPRVSISVYVYIYTYIIVYRYSAPGLHMMYRRIKV